MSFTFWRIMPDGTAEPTADDLEVNAGESLFYGTIEGAIIHAGVLACAFERKSVMTYCAKTFFETGKKVETGTVTTTRITAEPESDEMKARQLRRHARLKAMMFGGVSDYEPELNPYRNDLARTWNADQHAETWRDEYLRVCEDMSETKIEEGQRA